MSPSWKEASAPSEKLAGKKEPIYPSTEHFSRQEKRPKPKSNYGASYDLHWNGEEEEKKSGKRKTKTKTKRT